MNTFKKMSGKEKKIPRKESTNSELQKSLMVLKTQIDNIAPTVEEIGLSIQKQIDSAAMQEKINLSLQKQIDSIVSHLVTMKKEFLEKVETIETQYRATNVAFEELKQQQQQQEQQQQQQQLQQQQLQQQWQQQQQQQQKQQQQQRQQQQRQQQQRQQQQDQ